MDQRLEEIRKFNLDMVLIVPFDKTFSKLTAQEFIQKILINLLKAKIVVVGENFRFGHERQGDSRLLDQLASRYDIHVFSLPSVTKDGSTVSSSLIRSLLQEGQVKKANILLGRPYEISGEVIRGQARGKSIGFPTANIRTPNEILPRGVFVTRAGIDAKTWPSVTNIGQRPTFGHNQIIIESYLLGFNRDLYGKNITIQFLQKIREEKKFISPQDLSDQIRKDIETATRYFQRTPHRII
jgi:riboflavin kinase/FMN adenylyltransferase